MCVEALLSKYNANEGHVDRSRVKEMHYITPIVNLPSIIANGLLSHARVQSIGHVSVANEEVQDRRSGKRVPNGRPLHDYVNTYFDARNPMMYSRRAHKSELAVLRISPDILDIPGAIIADGNAAADATRFDPSPGGLSLLNEELVYAEYWTDSNMWAYYEKKRQRCAEVLVPDCVPPELLSGCYVCGSNAVSVCRDHAEGLEVVVNTSVFFG